MGIRNLAEAIILQGISDLWSDDERGDCIRFFKGEGFRTCADMAGMNLSEQVKLLTYVKETVQHNAAKSGAGMVQAEGDKYWNKQQFKHKSRGSKRIVKGSNERLSMAF